MSVEREPILDYIVLSIPADIDPDHPDVQATLDDQAQFQVLNQYRKARPKAIVIDPIEWLITSDWRDVEAHQPAHDCATCRAGNDQAVAFLKEHPDRRLALGNMRYFEVW